VITTLSEVPWKSQVLATGIRFGAEAASRSRRSGQDAEREDDD